MTGLRGIAALLVVTYHFYPPSDNTTNPFSLFIGKGYLWVDLFFVLSGFLLALNYAHLFSEGWSFRAWVDFLMRRLARVYPLYIAIVAATLIYTVSVYGSFQSKGDFPSLNLSRPLVEIIANIALIQSWGVARSIDGVAWSLSTEWCAYLLFPVLVWLALFCRRRTAALAVITVALTAIATVSLTMTDGAYHSGPLDAYDGTTMQPLLRCIGGFLLGILTYRAAQSPKLLGLVARDGVIFAAVALLAWGFAAGAYDLFVYPLFAVMVLGLYGNRGWLGRLFGCAPVYWLGLVSYSLYLLHIYLLGPRYQMEQWLRGWMTVDQAGYVANAAVYVFLLALSGLTYWAVEEPGRRWMRRGCKVCMTRLFPERTHEETRVGAP
jgi:peptidoglycan/LPS O-acetylase OafA/YrhL